MAIASILVIGNRDISQSIISALAFPSENESAPYRISVLTQEGQTPYLPSHTAPRSVEHKTSDFTAASLERAFAGRDVIISTVFGADYDLQASIINAAVAAGVKGFIPHEFGHDTINTKVQRRISGGAERAKVIEHLRANRSIEWVAVAVGCVLDTALLAGNLGFDLEWQSSSINGSGEETFPAISLERVGVVIRRVIEHWETIKNQYIYATGVITSGNELVASLERTTASKWSIGHSEVYECVREGESRVSRGFLDSGMFLLERSVLYDEALHATEPFKDRSANKDLNLEPETVDGIVSKAYHEFNHRGKLGCGCGS
ncbi:isoflavone reductase family protein [Lentithecium fluviatile CBS 122367]|uniref:Isoflavone reductase family protein n=1 Tax=Lentithecium fluviatile CBS 122367 TaxID=1168545 RepID=A0A6G1IPU8_9PLEO|nr:isoflavone reductase family protein [Lentithecium fluviatile CBS 122367]